ncbi:MAG: EF-hand domain-containing protein [Albidovulum sp.]|jgi:hypothetical protein
MKTLALAFAAITSFAAVAAQAQTAVSDTDGNGTYSMEEVQAAYPALTAEAFTAIDVNADGTLDADELAAAIEAGALPS